MARRFVRAPLKQGQRRQALWIGLSVAPVAVGAGAKVLVASLNAVALALRPFTIVRTRFFMQIESDQSIASELARGVTGMIVVTDQAVAAGSASVPGPVTDPDAGFHVYEPWVNSFLFATAIGFQEPAGTTVPSADSKAMRKVGNNEDLAVVCENTSAGGIGVLLTMQGRILVKLH